MAFVAQHIKITVSDRKKFKITKSNQIVVICNGSLYKFEMEMSFDKKRKEVANDV